MKSLRHTLAALVITAAALLSGFFSGPAAAGAMSDYLENKLVDYVFRGQAYTAPTTVHVALATAAGTTPPAAPKSPAALMPGWPSRRPWPTGPAPNPPAAPRPARAPAAPSPTTPPSPSRPPRPTGAR